MKVTVNPSAPTPVVVELLEQQMAPDLTYKVIGRIAGLGYIRYHSSGKVWYWVARVNAEAAGGCTGETKGITETMEEAITEVVAYARN